MLLPAFSRLDLSKAGNPPSGVAHATGTKRKMAVRRNTEPRFHTVSICRPLRLDVSQVPDVHLVPN
jgi:hypothetical protein